MPGRTESGDGIDSENIRHCNDADDGERFVDVSSGERALVVDLDAAEFAIIDRGSDDAVVVERGSQVTFTVTEATATGPGGERDVVQLSDREAVEFVNRQLKKVAMGVAPKVGVVCVPYGSITVGDQMDDVLVSGHGVALNGGE